ncbi:MAG: glycosyltransferase family 39 protein [Flavobacteriales bacterium]|nr:glycosyltransferase family 39 protein [Flavobacteriales bacterium]
MSQRAMWYLPAIALLLLALAAWYLAGLEFSAVRNYLDRTAPDGEVETYSEQFHARVLGNLRTASAGLGAAGLAALLWARSLASGRKRHEQSTGWPAFKTDLRRGIHGLTKRTSVTHKRIVLVVILIGAALRISQLWQPVIYDEAFTYVYFAARPFHVILSDYSYPNNHILHTLLVKLSTAVFGMGRVQLRLPALIAGILVMPLFYAFARAMFNRYIALIALSFVAASGCLIEYSALGRGYSLTWLFMVLSWIIGRHFAKTNNTVTAALFALVNALGMWTVPTMIYIAVAGYCWLVMYLMTKYTASLQQRMGKLLLSLGGFVLLTLFFYLPVVVVHGVAQLFHHPTMGEVSWEQFSLNHQDRSFDLFAYINDTAATWISGLGLLGLIYASYISSKFRLIMAATALGAIPIVILQANVGPPRVWLYILFMLHLSSAIAIFYLLKLVQESMLEKLSKRVRTVAASVVVLTGMGYLGLTGIQGRIERFPEAASAAAQFRTQTGPEDRVLVQFPWEAPLEFEVLAQGLDRQLLYRDPGPKGTTYILVSPSDGQTLEGVLLHHDLPPSLAARAEKVTDRKRSEIFALP